MEQQGCSSEPWLNFPPQLFLLSLFSLGLARFRCHFVWVIVLGKLHHMTSLTSISKGSQSNLQRLILKYSSWLWKGSCSSRCRKQSQISYLQGRKSIKTSGLWSRREGILSAGTGSILAEILKIIHSGPQFENNILFPNGMFLIGKMKNVSLA